MFKSLLMLCSISCLFTLTAQAKVLGLTIVDPGKVLRGSQPNTLQDYADLKYIYHVRTILNLRNAGGVVDDEKRVTEEFGINFRNAPIGTFLVDRNQVEEALKIVNDPDLQPVYVHCYHGRDRTGLICGLHRVLHQGWNPDCAREEMHAFGYSAAIYSIAHMFNTFAEGRDGNKLCPAPAVPIGPRGADTMSFDYSHLHQDQNGLNEIELMKW